MSKKDGESRKKIDYFTPWEDQVDDDNFLAPAHSQQHVSHIKLNSINTELQQNKTIEQKATKTLLNLQYQAKVKQISDIKSYIQNKNKIKYESPLPYGIKSNHRMYQLPNNYQHHKTIDVYDRSLILKDVYDMRQEQESIFKKYGEHRKSPYKEMIKVERSVSFGSVVAKEILNNDYQLKREYSKQIKPHYGIDKPQKLKLLGKKYSYTERQINSSKLQYELSYLPSHPIITPISMLFGHKKEDVLKNVLKQINHKIK